MSSPDIDRYVLDSTRVLRHLSRTVCDILRESGVKVVTPLVRLHTSTTLLEPAPHCVRVLALSTQQGGFYILPDFADCPRVQDSAYIDSDVLCEDVLRSTGTYWTQRVLPLHCQQKVAACD